MTLSNVIHLPTTEEAETAKISSRTLSKYAHSDRLNLKVTLNGGETEDLILPGFAINMLLDVLTEMSKGNAVTLMPINAELSTQQAADILNISRPYLVTLLEQGVMPYRKVGTHRRIMAKDVFEYKQRTNNERLEKLNELVAQAQEHGMGYE